MVGCMGFAKGGLFWREDMKEGGMGGWRREGEKVKGRVRILLVEWVCKR